MRARMSKATNTNEARLIDTYELTVYTGLGRNSATKFGAAAGAKIKFGKRTLWDKSKIDAYINSLMEV